jgi:general secretion pathway protein K
MKQIALQEGVALIMALVIVVMVSIVSISMITERQLQIHRTTNIYANSQAYQFAVAVERWGLGVLQLDYKKDKDSNQFMDGSQDIWNTSLFDFPVEMAKVNATIFDLQGRFNLNNLVVQGKVNIQWLEAYKRLLSALGLSVSLADALVDWMDVNEQPMSVSGAEDIYYMSQDSPYRTANQALSNLSELLLVKGYSADIYEILKSHVYVADELTAVNINTASSKVMEAMVPGLSPVQSESLTEQLKSVPFLTLDEFINHETIKEKAVVTEMITVRSDYFVVNSSVNIDKINLNLQSVLYRDQKGSVFMMNRQELPLYIDPVKIAQPDNDTI